MGSGFPDLMLHHLGLPCKQNTVSVLGIGQFRVVMGSVWVGNKFSREAEKGKGKHPVADCEEQ